MSCANGVSWRTRRKSSFERLTIYALNLGESAHGQMLAMVELWVRLKRGVVE